MQAVEDLAVECPHCRAANRVAALHFNDAPTCGRCRRKLLEGGALALTDENFPAVINASDRPVVIDFWAGWCAPCKLFAPVFAAVAAKAPALLFARVETDVNPHVASRYAVHSVPTIVVFRDGHIVDRISGALPAAQFEAWLRSALT